MDLSCLNIKIFEATGETKEEIEKELSKKQFKTLQEKYIDFKEKNKLKEENH